MDSPRRIAPLQVFLLVMLAVVWGSSFILMKRALRDPMGGEVFSPVQVASLRMTIAGIVLLPFAVVTIRHVRRSDWAWLAVVGICGSGIPAFLFTLAQQHMASSVAGMLNALTPLFTMLVGWVLFGSAFRKHQVAGIVVGLCGTASLVWLRAGDDGTTHGGWALLVVLATLCYGISVNTIQHRLAHLNGLRIAALSMMLAAIPCSVIAWWSHPGAVVLGHPWGWRGLVAVLVLGALGSALANVLFFRLTHSTSALFAASVTYLMPLVAVGWGLLDHEQLGALHLIAGGAILAGVWLIRMPGPQKGE